MLKIYNLQYISIFLCAFLLCFSVPSLTYAQDADLQEEDISEEDMDTVEAGEEGEEEVNKAKGVKDLVVFKGKEFRRSNFQNMSKLFWHFGFPSLDNDEHIDIFFQINECDLYKKYYGDEFEWGPLRETMREYLEGNSQNFSRRLYFDLPIEVGTYNIDKGNFVVISKNFSNAERDFFPHPTYVGWDKDFCGFRRSLTINKAYPREALFRFIRPINVPHIKVDEAIAKKLVKEWKDRKAQKRYLAIRMYVTITKFLGIQDFANQDEIPVYLSYIDGYEVYENLEMENLFFTKSFIQKKKEDIPTINTARGSGITNQSDEQAKEAEKKKKAAQSNLTPEEKLLLEFE